MVKQVCFVGVMVARPLGLLISDLADDPGLPVINDPRT